MDKTGSLQIGHSFIKEKDFKIKCKVTNDQHVEVPFSHRHLFYAVYWIHEGKGTHVIDFQEYEIKTRQNLLYSPRAGSLSASRSKSELFSTAIYGRFYNAFFRKRTKRNSSL